MGNLHEFLQTSFSAVAHVGFIVIENYRSKDINNSNKQTQIETLQLSLKEAYLIRLLQIQITALDLHSGSVWFHFSIRFGIFFRENFKSNEKD